MKRKININRPEISSEEIAQHKNFDSVLKQHITTSGKPFFKKTWFLSSVVATVAIVATIIVLNQNKKSDSTLPMAVQESTNDNDSLALIAFYKTEEAKPCINPPLKGVNVEYTTFKIIAEKGATLDFKTGSKITIPKNAFVDEKGNVLKGEIELRYREFHDAADFFVSGIPMTYDSAGVKYQFESAGMMEMLAYQNGRQINMAPKKEITIELASDYKGTEYNLYKLDTVKNNWSCIGKDRVVAKEEKSLASVAGTKNVSDNFNSEGSVQETPKYKSIETKKVEIKKEKEVQIAALPKPMPEPKKPVQVKKEKYTFNIDVDAREFPELYVYKGLLFEVGDENKNFNTSLYDITWDEASIKEGNKVGENYNLTLKKGIKKYDLVVYPVYEGKGYETAMKNYQEKFNKYKITLDKRLAEEKRIEEVYQVKLAALKKEQEEQIRLWEKQQAELVKQMSTRDQVFRMFAVNSFGVFNCDHPSVYPKGVLCTANVKDDKNENLRCYDIYLVDKEKNGLFTYTRNPIVSFSFNPKSKNLLWTVENGVLYWLKPEQFNAITGSNGAKDLIMNKVDQKFETLDELKMYFNF